MYELRHVNKIIPFFISSTRSVLPMVGIELVVASKVRGTTPSLESLEFVVEAIKPVCDEGRGLVKTHEFVPGGSMELFSIPSPHCWVVGRLGVDCV